MEFCHDYQNNRCTRALCKYIHCISDVEAEFKKSGYLPPSVRDQVINKGVAVDFPATTGGVPICKDFLKVSPLSSYGKFLVILMESNLSIE